MEQELHFAYWYCSDKPWIMPTSCLY